MHCHKDRNVDKLAWHPDPDPLDKQSLKPDPDPLDKQSLKPDPSGKILFYEKLKFEPIFMSRIRF